jgi:regulator of RNase E activity RraA
MKVDACAVSDALDRMSIAGAVLGLQAFSTSKRIAGRAITVQLGPADGRKTQRHLCTAAVEAGGPGDIIMVANEGRTHVGAWGGLLSLAAKIRNIEGVIVDGACRDLDESREMGLPVYTRAGIAITARSRIVEYDWNVPVTMSGVLVSPGDYVIADASGVLVIPSKHADQVIAVAERIAEKERLMAADIRSGRSISTVMGKDYETLLARKEM